MQFYSFSATRNLALRALGLRATSSSSGTITLLFTGRNGAATRPKKSFLGTALEISGLEKVFYQAVFERVVGKYSDTASGAHQLGSRRQHTAQRRHLLVDLDAQGLEKLCQLFLLLPLVDTRHDHIDQTGRRIDFLHPPGGNYCLGNAAAERNSP